MKPLVSILVPIYNVEKYIVKCARSLFDQTYDNIQFVFVNDCSPDKSLEALELLIKEYPQLNNRIIIKSHTVNRGLAASRITGLKYSTGELVTFVDSDDYLEKEAVEECVNKLLCDGSDIVAFGFTHEKEDYCSIVLPQYNLSKRDYLLQALERKIQVNICGKLYKKDLFEQYDVNFIEGINYGEDYVVGARILYYANKISYVNKPYYHYVHFNSTSYTNVFRHHSLVQLLHAEGVVSDFYFQKGDVEYIQAHKVGRLKLKVEMIVAYVLSEKKDANDYSMLLDLYPQESGDKTIIKKLSRQDRLSIKVINTGNKAIIEGYIFIGFKLKKLINKYRLR